MGRFYQGFCLLAICSSFTVGLASPVGHQAAPPGPPHTTQNPAHKRDATTVTFDAASGSHRLVLITQSADLTVTLPATATTTVQSAVMSLPHIGFHPDAQLALQLEQELRQAYLNTSALRKPHRFFHTKAHKAKWLQANNITLPSDAYCSAMFMEDDLCDSIIEQRPWIIRDLVLVAYKRVIFHFVSPDGIPYDPSQVQWTGETVSSLPGSGAGAGMQRVINDSVAILRKTYEDEPRGGKKAKSKWLVQHHVEKGSAAYCAAMMFETTKCGYVTIGALTDDLS